MKKTARSPSMETELSNTSPAEDIEALPRVPPAPRLAPMHTPPYPFEPLDLNDGLGENAAIEANQAMLYSPELYLSQYQATQRKSAFRSMNNILDTLKNLNSNLNCYTAPATTADTDPEIDFDNPYATDDERDNSLARRRLDKF